MKIYVFAFPIKSGIVVMLMPLGRLFFENLGNGKAAAKWLKFVKGPFWVIWGRRRFATQVVDFHGNSG
jgi:hypothetical protein